MSESIREINNISDYHYCVGRIMYFCQCIEHDIKLIYSGMRKPMNANQKAQFEKWTLGKTISELEALDNSDGKPYFSSADYELLRNITSIRNYYAHKCYMEFTYEQDEDWNIAFEKSAKRLVNDHNRLAKLYGSVEDARLRFFEYK